MVDELLQWDALGPDLDIRLSQAFRPSTAIDRKDFFHGRNALIRRLVDTANQSGQHAIIYGERGVGKTSLANVLADFLTPYISESIAVAKVNCYRETTYQGIWDSLFKQVGLSEKSEYNSLILDDVVDTLREDTERKLILIVDEFDRIEDPDIDVLFADTIKALSDFNVDTTLILVGVADDIDDLITEHESVNRCLVQIHLPRMSVDELREIVKFGIDGVGMEISQDAIHQICAVSLGLPHYAHSFGLASGRAAIDRMSLKVETPDVDTAMNTLISESQQTVLQRFDMATSSPRRQNNYFKALLACALAQTDALGYFRAANVREPYSQITGHDQTISSFSRHLHGLSSEERGAVLQKFGEAHNYRFRFTDPVMQPHVLMRGMERNLINWDGINAITSRND